MNFSQQANEAIGRYVYFMTSEVNGVFNNKVNVYEREEIMWDMCPDALSTFSGERAQPPFWGK